MSLVQGFLPEVHSRGSKILLLKTVKLPIPAGIKMDVNFGYCLFLGLVSDANI